MAIMESPECIGLSPDVTTTSPPASENVSNSLNSDLRRRASAAVKSDIVMKELESDLDLSSSSKVNGSNSEEDCKRNEVTNGDGGMKLAGELSNERDDKYNKVGNGDGGGGGGVEASFKYAFRASVPAHRKIKESPLSSDAIFKQVWNWPIVTVCIHDFPTSYYFSSNIINI